MNSRQILHFSIGPVGAAALGFITLPLIAWFFPVEDIGRLTMLHVTVGFCTLLFSMGLDQAYVREYHEVKNKPALLKAAMLPGLFILAISLLTLEALPVSVSAILFETDSAYLNFILYLSILLAFVSRFLSLVLRMQERGLAYSMSQLLPKLIFLVIMAVYIGFSFSADFSHLITANAISLLAVFLIYSWNTRGDWLAAIKSNIDKKKSREMLHFGLPLIAGGLAFWALTSMDRFFLRAMSSFEELGIYSVAISFSGVAVIFQSIFSTVWAPTVYKWAADEMDNRKIENIIGHALAAVAMLWALAGMFSWLVTCIVPSTYERVQYILVASMAYPLLYTLSEATGVGIGIKRKTLYSMLASVLALLINALGNFYLIPEHGAAGAAFSSAVAFLVFFVVRTEVSARLWFSFRRTGLYILVFLLTAMSLLNLAGNENIQTVLVLVWSLISLVIFVKYRKNLGYLIKKRQQN